VLFQSGHPLLLFLGPREYYSCRPSLLIVQVPPLATIELTTEWRRRDWTTHLIFCSSMNSRIAGLVVLWSSTIALFLMPTSVELMMLPMTIQRIRIIFRTASSDVDSDMDPSFVVPARIVIKPTKEGRKEGDSQPSRAIRYKNAHLLLVLLKRMPPKEEPLRASKREERTIRLIPTKYSKYALCHGCWNVRLYILLRGCSMIWALFSFNHPTATTLEKKKVHSSLI
jgi:hypothetical protein